MKKILILDDNLTICLMLKSWIAKKGYMAETATNVDDAKQMVRDKPFDLILSDIRMPDTDGFSFLSWVKKFDSEILVIMMTGYADIESAVEAMKSGAVDYISKPIEPELLFKKIEDAFKLQSNQNQSKRFFNTFVKPVGGAYENLFKKLDALAESRTHFMLVGDRGTGKSTMARYVYEKGAGDTTPFVIFDADQFYNNPYYAGDTSSQSVLEQKFNDARGGLLFVRKIHKLDKITQDELLSIISKQPKDEFYTQIVVSSEKSRKELQVLLLPKLYQVLEPQLVVLPSLKGDNETILFFADYFLEFANAELDKNVQSISPGFKKYLITYPWTGNIQELKNIVLKAVLLSTGTHISEEVLPSLSQSHEPVVQPVPQPDKGGIVVGLRKENYEKEKIREALELAKGNKTMAASILNIDRKTLYNKIKLYNVEYAN